MHTPTIAFKIKYNSNNYKKRDDNADNNHNNGNNNIKVFLTLENTYGKLYIIL